MEITMVRVYLTEADKMLGALMQFLNFEMKVQGVTVLKAVAGFGKGGAMHTIQSEATRHDLPLVLEFYDQEDEVVTKAIKGLKSMVGSTHVIAWKAWIPN